MQQIERYGVIALMFLLVTIVVVALWDGGDPAEAGGGEQEKVAQVDRATTQQTARTAQQPARKTQQPTRNTINRRPTPSRGTRTQAQNRAKTQGTRLNRGDSTRNALDQRSRLVNPNGVPSSPNARPVRPRTQERISQPVRRDSAATERNQGFKAELPRGRNTNQYGAGKSALANIATVASDPTPAFREMRNKAKKEVKRKPDPVKGPMYVIKSGDSLERIARHTLGDGSRWREIQQLNGMRGTTVVVGKKLRLPVGADSSRTSYASAKKKARGVTEAASRVAAGTGHYAVQSGDSLSKIAERELGSYRRMDEILALNPGLTARNLRAGSKINMPVRGKTSAWESSVDRKMKSTKKPSTKKTSKPKADSRFVVH